MVGVTRVSISNCGIFCSSNFWHYWFSNKNWKKFLLAGIITNLRRCHLQWDYSEKLIFVSKNWPNDLRVGCNSSSTLIELIEADLALEKELEQYEGEFERDELLDL